MSNSNIDEIFQQNGYNLTQIVGETESTVWFTLTDFLKAKQAIQQELLKAKLQVIRDIKNSEGYGRMPIGMRDLLSDMSQQLNSDLQAKLKEMNDE